MILIDYNGIVVPPILSGYIELEENLVRHTILNSLRMYRKKFGQKYGELVICCDAGNNWRKDIFPEYKASRKINRDASDFDWNKAFNIINTVRQELIENFPYKLIWIDKCEGDDIIGTLAEWSNEFGNYEEIMIVSSDKDFAQLQKYPNINQYSNITRKFIKEESPRTFLFKHICKGDGSDGVPNVMSPDDIFLQEGVRQGTMHQKKIDAWAAAEDMRKAMGEDVYRNYQRNKKMIDLSETPQDLKDKIINIFESQLVADSSKVMPFLIKKRCRALLEQLGDFV